MKTLTGRKIARDPLQSSAGRVPPCHPCLCRAPAAPPAAPLVVVPSPLSRHRPAFRWSQFSSGWLVGGLSGVAWSYILTQVLPYYS